MNIAGVLVHAMPEQVDAVKKRLIEISGVEIHAVTDDGRLIITVEDEDGKVVGNTVINLHQCEGVISAAMVYQYGDDDEALEEEIVI